MHDEVVTFILAGGDGRRLQPLTTDQAKATLPFGGLFRLMDFALANVLSSQLRRIFVLTCYKHERVLNYIGSSWPQLSADFRWECGEDLSCLPPAETLRQIPEILAKSAEYALIVSADQIYQMDYRKLLRLHLANQADVSSPMKGVYLFSRDAILRAGELDLADYSTTDPVFGGYCRTIETLDDYHAANMDLLTERTGFDPYAEKKLLHASRFASNSKVVLGARLSGCKVVGSIISAGVRVERGAIVENSVILAGCHIGQGAEVRNAIVTENSVVPAHIQLGVDHEADRRKYTVTPNGVTVFANHPEDATPLREVRRRCARVATKAHFAVVR